jgi:hypothetical protein
MSIEQGRLLAGRYRVEDLVTDRAGARTWRAVDEVLRRSVCVDILAANAPRADALVNAARRSAIVADSRFLRVLDASHENGDVYVVREWARGESLERVLADGPLIHRHAAWVVREIAEALAVAHRAGIYHWRLLPDSVTITETGAVRITGLATDAALEGLRYADAEAVVEDVRGIGRLLYATLVTRWPGGTGSALPAAPSEHGRLLRPRQVRAGVPGPLDEICDRILGEPPRHHTPPMRTCDEVVVALSEAAGLAADQTADPEATQASGFGVRDVDSQEALGHTRHFGRVGVGVPLGPPPAVLSASPNGPRPAATTDGPNGNATGSGNGSDRGGTAPTTVGPTPSHRPADPGERRWTWLIASLVVLVCAVGAFVVGFTVNGGRDDADDTATDAGAGAPPAPRPARIAAVQAWDPYGESGENDEDAPLTVDGDVSTAWTTMSYRGNPEFGGLKPGLGLIVDLGRPRDVSTVTVNLGGAGTDLEVRVAPGNNDGPPADPDDFQVQGSATGASGRTAVDLDRAITTRYVLVWLTKLPPEDGEFRGRVNEVSVLG